MECRHLESAETMVPNPVHPADESECSGVQDEMGNIDITPDDCTAKEQFALACTDPQNPPHWAVQDLNL